jgi:lyso-ornithine lipid O-acyltransferase
MRGTIGWLRIAARLLAMILLLCACVFLHYLWKLAGSRGPWSRRFLAGTARIAGVRISVTGHRAQGDEFLLANHVSWIDIAALGGVSGAAFVGHDGLASMPLIRWLCAINGTVFVTRHERSGLARQIENLRAAVAQNGALAVFPEGTTSDGTSLLPFKSSLLSALDPLPPGLTVQPVLLDYGRHAAEIGWIGTEHGVDNFKRILARSELIELNVHFLPPLNGEALANRKAIAAAARAAIDLEMQTRR